MFFISPPPSPPCGWEVREEEPPNKDTHAEDLERALSGLTHQGGETEIHSQTARSSPQDVGTSDQAIAETENDDPEKRKLSNRSRSRSMTVYDPKDHGSNQDLPAVMVEDTSADEEDEPGLSDDLLKSAQQPITKTSRPPVELMEE